MGLKEYFGESKGFGVIATADAEGRVNAAVYARPHVFAEDSVGFLMTERLTYANVQSNPHAAYLFREEGEGYRGKRLYLTKTAVEKDTERVKELRRRTYGDDREGRYLVTFKVDKVLPLVGAGED